MVHHNDREKPEETWERRHLFSFQAIGTGWEIETAAPLSDEVQRHILERIDQFDAVYSRFRPDSLIARVASAPGGGDFPFPEDSASLFELYDRLHRTTAGAIDPLVGRDLERLGYDRHYSLSPGEETPSTNETARKKPSWSKDVIRQHTLINTQRPLVLDVGAAGKGYLIDIICELLLTLRWKEFVVDGSGDLRHVGSGGARIGLEHPFDPQLVVGTVCLNNQSLGASAINRRAWGEGLHHIIDPKTGRPVQGVAATWVIADEAAVADGLATALFVSDSKPLMEAFRFSYVRMFTDGSVEVSPNFDGHIFR